MKMGHDDSSSAENHFLSSYLGKSLSCVWYTLLKSVQNVNRNERSEKKPLVYRTLRPWTFSDNLIEWVHIIFTYFCLITKATILICEFQICNEFWVTLFIEIEVYKVFYFYREWIVLSHLILRYRLMLTSSCIWSISTVLVWTSSLFMRSSKIRVSLTKNKQKSVKNNLIKL
jgi:hypothetical protein